MQSSAIVLASDAHVNPRVPRPAGAVRALREHHLPMRSRSVQPGDIVLVSKRGRLFHATVRGAAAGGGFDVAPIERGITYRHVKAAEISEHWARSRARREGRPPTGQMGFEDLGEA